MVPSEENHQNALIPANHVEQAVRRFGVVGVVPIQNRLLVIQRSQTVRAPGAYCFPGGGIESGETEPQALIREMMEELNVETQPIRKLWHSVTARGVSLAWWLASITDQKPIPNPAEVASVHQLTVDEISDLPSLLSSNHDFLAALRAGEFQLDH